MFLSTTILKIIIKISKKQNFFSSGSQEDMHQSTCAVVVHTIGLLKARWMCLDIAGGKLLYSPEKP